MGRPWPATNCSRSGGSGARHVHAGICMVHQLYFAKYRSGLSQTPRPTSILNCTTANRLIYNGVAPFEYEVEWRMQGGGGGGGAPVA